ncbi:AcrB/AcrD/AcrF family protein [candidate division KSB1 bacterium]|nr:MAG: AcrB/AcrD/AcrF family protein [candidate division KSB1 bacterium]
MKIVKFSINRPVTISMFVAAAILFGIVSFKKLAINLLPDITYPTLTIRTEYSGTAPGEMENLIAKPIEEAVGVVKNVVRVSSISRSGVTDVMLEFNWGTNMDFAAMDVREKLDLLYLPQDAEKPVLMRFDPSLDPIMRIGLFGEEDLIKLRILAELDIKRALESLEGVAAVKINGGLEEEIHVEINQAKLASIGIPLSQVINRLDQENINLTGGRLKDGDSEYLVRTLNEFKEVNEIADIVILEKNEAPIRVRDVGNVFKSYKERKIITRINGKESVEIAVYKEADANTVMVAKLVKDRLNELQNEFKKTSNPVQMEVVTDQSLFIQQAINEVLKTAIYGGILAVLVLFFFLRNLKSTSIISLSIPVSVVATFFLMYSFHVSLNIMSLGGLALGIGMLVDNSIVVLESIDRKQREGLSIRDATYEGTSIVGKAVIASTLTTVCVFVPIIFVKGIAGQLFKDQALTVTFSLMASLVVAITLIPMLSSLSFSREDLEFEEKEREKGRSGYVKKSVINIVTFIPLLLIKFFKILFKATSKIFKIVLYPIFWLFEKIFSFLFKIYPPVLEWCLNNKLKVFIIAIVMMILSYFGYKFLGTELIPEMKQGQFYVNVNLPVGTSVENTDETLTGMSRIVAQEPYVNTVYTISGSSNQSGVSSVLERENIGQINVILEKGRIDKEEIIIDDLRKKFKDIPGIEPPKFERPSFFSFKTPVEVEVRGYNLDVLDDIASRIMEKLSRIPGLTDVRSSTEGANPEIEIIFNRKKVAALGSNISSISSIIRSKIEGEVATRFKKRDRQIDIRVRARKEDRKNLEDLKRIIINPQGDVPVPLFAVADLTLERGPSEIRRIDQERVAVISANVQGRDLGSVAKDIHNAVKNIPIPPDFSIEVGGQNEEMSTSFASMRFAILLAIFLVYLVMASQFESLLHPFVIMFTIPFSLIGVVSILLFTGCTISVIVLIGLIMLAGIVVNNAIVLIDYVNYLRRRGMNKIAALIEGGKVRLRPILMTTFTTVLGLLPMAIGLGEGAEVRTPMAITVIGGLVFGTIVNLLFLPVVYCVLDRRG